MFRRVKIGLARRQAKDRPKRKHKMMMMMMLHTPTALQGWSARPKEEDKKSKRKGSRREDHFLGDSRAGPRADHRHCTDQPASLKDTLRYTHKMGRKSSKSTRLAPVPCRRVCLVVAHCLPAAMTRPRQMDVGEVIFSVPTKLDKHRRVLGALFLLHKLLLLFVSSKELLRCAQRILRSRGIKCQ